MSLLQNDGNFMERFMQMQARVQAPQPSGKDQVETQSAPRPDAPPSSPTHQTPQILQNDGNFMDRFKEMQQQSASTQQVPRVTSQSQVDAAKGPVEANAPRQSSTSGTFHAFGVKPKQAYKQAPSKISKSIFGAPETEDGNAVASAASATAPDIPPKTRATIEKCANWVAQNGDMFEQVLKKKNSGDPMFSFLFDTTSAEAVYYRDRVSQAKGSTGAGLFDSVAAKQEEKRRKRSRWGAPTAVVGAGVVGAGAVVPAPAQSATSDAASAALAVTQRLQGAGAWTQPSAPTNFNPIDAAKAAAAAVAARLNATTVAQQHTVVALPSPPGKRRFSETGAGAYVESGAAAAVPGSRLQSDLDKDNAGGGVVPVPDLNMYGDVIKSKEARDTLDDAWETGGRVEGGTWEHRARAREMVETAKKNAEITKLNRGKHHLGDFLPKERLEAFLAKCRSVLSTEGVSSTEGAAAAKALEDFAANKLTSDNVGFQMLQGLGWSEGQGLGSGGAGITAPVAMGSNTGHMGLGMEAQGEVTQSDDAFDQYRKRMMLAYRFRPNPGNNPRRSYDGYATL